MSQVTLHKPPVPEYGYQYSPGVFNTQVAKAQAAGDTRFQTKQLDRAGMSRGGGQRQEAESRGGAALADGVSQAYMQRDTDRADIHGKALGAATSQEQLAQQLDDLQYNLNMDQFTRKMNILQGLL